MDRAAAQSLLSKFMRAARPRRWIWGEWDCSLFAATWIEYVTGRAVAEGWRGTYRSAGEAAALASAHGGFEALVARELDPLFERREAPEPGDVGLVVTDPGAADGGGFGLALAVRSMHLWTGPGRPGGVAGFSAELRLCWRIV